MGHLIVRVGISLRGSVAAAATLRNGAFSLMTLSL